VKQAGLPAPYWVLWAGYLANRLGLLSPGFLALYLSDEDLATGGQIGLTIGAYGAGLVAGGLLGGLVADRAGPRRTLWTSQALASLAGIGFMVAREPAVIMGLALAGGTLTGFPRSAVYSMAAQLTSPHQWARVYGQLYWATSLGASISALLAGFLLRLWPQSLFLPGVVGAAAYAAIALALPEAPATDRAVGHGVRSMLADLYRPFSNRCVGPFLLLTFATSCVYMQRQSAMPLDMHRHGLSSAQLGAILSLSATLVVFVQPFAARATHRLPAGHAFAASAALIGVGFGINIVAGTTPQYAIAVTVWTCGEILMVPLAATFMADHAPAGRGGTFQGGYAFVWTLGLAVGAPAGQFLLITAGSKTLWSITLALGLAIAAAHLVVGGRCRRREHPERIRLSRADQYL
jgi:MFS family permease